MLIENIKYPGKKKCEISTVSVIVKMIILFLVIAFLFAGCTKEELIPRPQDRGASIECRDGHLYSIIENTRYQLIEQNGCKEGKVELVK